jgi:FKBP-type peptidyl-prolyl cis-trans isomerase SlyD
MSDEQSVKDGQIVSMEYTLRVEGEVIDSSEGGAPLEYLQGAGNIIPGLEQAMNGMKIGESKQVTVAAADGYGEADEEAFVAVPREHFPEHIPAEVGIELQVQNEQGQTMHARIEKVSESEITLNFNHPLAGKELKFDVKVVGLRDATEEEMEHGHAHGDGHAH